MARKRSRESASPDITPLIDVVFLLLIFFLVSTAFKHEELALLLNLPSSKSEIKSSVTDESIIVEVTEKETAVNGTKITDSQLASSLAKIANKNSKISLRIDKEVKYKRIIYFLDTLKQNQLTNIDLVTIE